MTMPRRSSISIELTMPQRRLLGKWHKGTLSTRFSRRLMVRVDVIMRAARGQTNYMIAKQLGISRNTVKLWRYRFAQEGMTGLITRPIPGRPRKQKVGMVPNAETVNGPDRNGDPVVSRAE
ncbi:MAG: helix-turn-helix domain-containing protein [Elusimicrobiota bacterium]